MTGIAPFRGDGYQLMTAKQAGWFEFDVVEPSNQAQRLCRGLLRIEPQSRLTIEDILDHEWMRDDEDYLKRVDLSTALEGLQYWE